MHSTSLHSAYRIVTWLQSEEGTVPVSSLMLNDKRVRSVKLEIDDGMLPVRKFSENDNASSSVKAESDDGIVPVNLFW
jgi:hypothetical protein